MKRELKPIFRKQLVGNDINQPIKFVMIESMTDKFYNRHSGCEDYGTTETTFHGSIQEAEQEFERLKSNSSVGDMFLMYVGTCRYSEFLDSCIDGDIDCFMNNYGKTINTYENEGKSIKNAIIVIRSWERYVNYASCFKGLRIGREKEVESDLKTGNNEHTFRDFEEVLLFDEEIFGLEDDVLLEKVMNALSDSNFKWNNTVSEEYVRMFLGIKEEV